jgi:hypothetical protein
MICSFALTNEAGKIAGLSPRSLAYPDREIARLCRGSRVEQGVGTTESIDFDMNGISSRLVYVADGLEIALSLG